MSKITTGFNPESVKKQIENFLEYGENAADKLDKAICDFQVATSNSWCSPRAVAFGRKYPWKYIINVENLRRCYNNISVAAGHAYNAYARFNDLPLLGEYFMADGNAAKGYLGMTESTTAVDVDVVPVDPQTGNELGYKGMTKFLGYNEKSPATGDVGMDKTVVQYALGEFKKSVSDGMRLIDETPMDIAFYDPDGLQVASYRAEINKLKQTCVDSFNEVCEQIEKAIDEEVQSITIASQEATDALRSTLSL